MGRRWFINLLVALVGLVFSRATQMRNIQPVLADEDPLMYHPIFPIVFPIEFGGMPVSAVPVPISRRMFFPLMMRITGR